MKFKFKDIGSFLRAVTSYNTSLRMYCRIFNNFIRAVAQSQKNTFEIEIVGEKKVIDQIEELLKLADFIKVEEIRTWEG